jgi:hypothetical protein
MVSQLPTPAPDFACVARRSKIGAHTLLTVRFVGRYARPQVGASDLRWHHGRAKAAVG